MQRKKTAIITARMTPGIRDLIQHQAKQAGMTVTDYIITCALGKEIVRVDGLDEILAEVKAQGRTSTSSRHWQTWDASRSSEATSS